MMWFRGTLRSTNARTLASRSIIYSLRLLQVRHEKAVRHSLLKVPDHRRLPCRDRDCQRLARSRSELDDIGPIALRAKDHDPVVASHYRRLVLCQSSSASRFTRRSSGVLHFEPIRRPEHKTAAVAAALPMVGRAVVVVVPGSVVTTVRSAASVGTARIAPDIIVRMPSRALRVLRIVLSVRFSRPVVWLKVYVAASDVER